MHYRNKNNREEIRASTSNKPREEDSSQSQRAALTLEASAPTKDKSKMAITLSVKQRVIEMRAEGVSYSKIAEALQIAKQTAVDVAKENIDQVGTLQAIETEAYFEERRVSKRGRIEQLSALQEKLRAEIERRDLTDVPTDKLITLFIKNSEALKGEVYSPSIRSTEEQQKDKNDREGWAALNGWG